LHDATWQAEWLVQAPSGGGGTVQLIVEAGGRTWTRSVTFRVPQAGVWYHAAFHWDQSLNGISEARATLRYTPDGRGYHRVKGFKLVLFPDEVATLPIGIPTTTDDRDDCFLAGEVAQWRAELPRTPVEGCPTGAVSPQVVLDSAPVYTRVNNQEVVDCSSLRKNVKVSQFIDVYASEVTSRAEKLPPTSADLKCVVNSLHLWASKNALTQVVAGGGKSQALKDRMWMMGGLGALYYRMSNVRNLSSSQGKDAQIVSWFVTIARQISSEIDATRARPPSEGGVSAENNLQYWRGFSILPAALMKSDAALLAQSQRVFRTALDEITTDREGKHDGFLLPELHRGTRGLSYHRFATWPILAMAMYSKAGHTPFLRPFDTGLLGKLIRRELQGYYQPKVFADEQRYRFGTGFEQSTENGAPADTRILMFFFASLDVVEARSAQTWVWTKTGRCVELNHGAREHEDRIGGRFQEIVKFAGLTAPPATGCD
jgi:Alginate lyase